MAPLVWDDDQLAADAQVWVDGLVARGGTLARVNPADPRRPGDRPRQGRRGEPRGRGVRRDGAHWYAEKPQFDAAPNKSGFNDTNPTGSTGVTTPR